ncbi:restriction endonuclease [Streptomyces sp. NBC_01456]|uniref:restriction endonuclease n=1 Tax=unclassified Streptomyces TaxID=2593676 RepID=UPI002E33B6C2|nr:MULTISPECIES: restriction endonuclease [unclassified Streptomyces]
MRRRTRQSATSRSVAVGFLLVIAVAVAREHPVTTGVLAALALVAAVAVLLVRTGRLQLPARPAAARADLTHSIAAYQHMTGTQFEHAIADLARRDPAVRSATVSGGANDRALDVLLRLTDGRRIAVQCKRYAPSNRVGAPVIYAVNGTYRAYHRCDQALIVTTSTFTPAAQRANAELDHPLRLVDGRALSRWVCGGRPPWGA